MASIRGRKSQTRTGSHFRTRYLIAALACIISVTASGQSIDTAQWTEEVRLSDGRMVVVWRKDRRGSFGFPNSQRGGLIDFELKYAPRGVHWKDGTSATHVRYPTSFDIIDGIPLVVLEGSWDVCLNRPKTDYAAQFLKWVDGQWVDVPQAEFPVDRVLVNLYRDRWGHTAKDDARGLVSWETKARQDGFNPDRPDTVKAFFERGARICANRPPQVVRTTIRDPRRDESPDGSPPAVKVELEILGEKTYEVPLAMRGDRKEAMSKWRDLASDKARDERCAKLLRSDVHGTTVESVRKWYLFNEDKTGSKRALYTHTAICDPDAIWLVDNSSEVGRTALWKYTIAGDFIYRISFKRPAQPFYYGGIMNSTFKAEDGYVRFEWLPMSDDPYVKRSLRMQIREP